MRSDLPTLFRALAALPLAILATPALAQTADTPPPQQPQPDIGRNSVTIGAGAVTIPQYEGADRNHWSAAPMALATIHGFNFTLLGNQATLDLIPNSHGSKWDIMAGPIGVLNIGRDPKHIDDPQVHALGKIKTAVELGGFIGIGKTGVITSPYDKLSVTLSYRHDVSGIHDAGIWTPSISYTTPLSRYNAVILAVSADRAEGGYARTYFGITPAQSVLSGLPVYSPHGGWKDYNISLLGTQAITGDLLHGLKLVGGGVYGRLMNDFGRSPITASKDQWTGALGLAYTF